MENVTKRLVEEAQACGHQDVRVRDVGYAVLAAVLRSHKMAQSLIFPSMEAEQAKSYRESPLQKTLAARVRMLLEPEDAPAPPPQAAPSAARAEGEITADENRLAMMRMLDEIEVQKQLPDADVPKLLKIEADIRTKLKDKFEVSQSAERQLIVVQPKYNHVCEWTGKECHLLTKEEAMARYGLVEPPPR